MDNSFQLDLFSRALQCLASSDSRQGAARSCPGLPVQRRARPTALTPTRTPSTHTQRVERENLGFPSLSTRSATSVVTRIVKKPHLRPHLHWPVGTEPRTRPSAASRKERHGGAPPEPPKRGAASIGKSETSPPTFPPHA